jgi:DNA-binding response OmpR family regulator
MIDHFPLVVAADDDPDILALVQLRLMLLDCHVVTAVDGEEALAAITKHIPALAVLDVAMPGMDGLTVLERVRANPATAGVPVILLSASVHDADVARGLERGADTYIKKPFEARELAAVIEGIFAEQSERAQRAERLVS